MYRMDPERIRRLRRALALALGTGCLLLATVARALPEDRQQPIRISADQALRDERQGYTEYTGNVRMQQGSLVIYADKVTIFHQQQVTERILAEGNPARLQQQPEHDRPLVHAAARSIEYFQTEERVQLRREARIEQDGSIVTGDTIEYFMAEQRVRADAGRPEDGGRVEVVIPAQVQEEANGGQRGTTQGE